MSRIKSAAGPLGKFLMSSPGLMIQTDLYSANCQDLLDKDNRCVATIDWTTHTVHLNSKHPKAEAYEAAARLAGLMLTPKTTEQPK